MKGLFFIFFESVGVPGGSPELGKGNLGWVPSLHLLQILQRSHGFPPRVVGAELGWAAEVVVATPEPDLQRICRGEGTLVGSGTLFPSLAVCNRPFDICGPCGTHSIWCCLFWLGSTSSRTAISEIFHVAPPARPVI